MSEESNQTMFFKTLLENSNNDDIKLAIDEWSYVYSFLEPAHCICGMPIRENCVIKNKYNGICLVVGNKCVNKFMKIDKEFIFKGIRSLLKNTIPNKEFINYCYEKEYLYENQKDFLLDRYRKRKHTPKQQEFIDKLLFKLKLKNKY